MRSGPKQVYFLHVSKGSAKGLGGLGYAQRGGGLFTSRTAAVARGQWLVTAGKIESYRIEVATCDWKEEV